MTALTHSTRSVSPTASAESRRAIRSGRPPTAGRELPSAIGFAFAAGLLYAIAFPPFNVVLLGWLFPTAMLLALQRVGSRRQAVLCGAIAAGTMCMIGMAWIADTAHRFWPVSWAFAGFLLLVYSTFGAIHITAFALLYRVLQRPLERAPAAVSAALFVVTEFATPKIFPHALAHTQLELPAFPAAASLVGTHGLSFLVAWLGMSLALVTPLRLRRRLASGPGGRRAALAELGLCVVLTAACWSYGAARMQRHIEVERQLDLVLIQGNIGDPVGLADELGSVEVMVDSVLQTYDRMTRDAVQADDGADFILWPETAVPTPGLAGEIDPLRHLVRELRVPLIFGGYDFALGRRGSWDVYNTLFWMDRQGVLRDRYHKSILIPLGESIPFADRFPFLADLMPTPGVFARGDGPHAMEIDGVRFAPMICYELLFANFVRGALKAGGEVLLNITNDYWFGRYAEAKQHLSLVRMRAFETGRPIIRATNTGYSALIDARGQIVLQGALGRAEVLRAKLEIPVMEWTPYARWGEMVTLLQVLLCIGLAFAGQRLAGRGQGVVGAGTRSDNGGFPT